MTKLLLMSFTLFICVTGHSQTPTSNKKHFYFFGNGEGISSNGKTTKNSNQFAKGLQEAVKVDKSVWSQRILFSPSVVLNQKAVNDLAGTSVKPFTKPNFDDQLQKINEDIDNGNVKQALIVVHSHGLQENGTHWFTMSKPDGTVDFFNIAHLEKLTEKAKDKGVQLAIVDLSCAAGVGLKLANSHTCVITGSSVEGLSYADDSWEFIRQLSKSKNLEEAFEKSIEAKLDSNLGGQPQISNQAHATAYAETKKILDQLDTMLHESLAKIVNAEANEAGAHCGVIKRQMQDLQKNLQKIIQSSPETAVQHQAEVAAVFEELKTDLEKLTTSRQGMMTIERRSPKYCYEEKDVFKNKMIQKCLPAVNALYNAEFFGNKQDGDEFSSGSSKKSNTGLSKFSYLTKTKDYSDYKIYVDGLMEAGKKFEKTKKKVALLQRKLYWNAYKEQKKAQASSKDPKDSACRNFSLQ